VTTDIAQSLGIDDAPARWWRTSFKGRPELAPASRWARSSSSRRHPVHELDGAPSMVARSLIGKTFR